MAGIVLWLFVLLAGKGYAQEDSIRSYQVGRSLFATSCSPCHGVHREKTGPMLASITKKRTTEWLVDFIHNSQSVIASGDSYANFLFRQYNQQVMPAFRHLSEKEVSDILHYITAESVNPVEEFSYAEAVRESGSETVLKGRDIFDAQCASCHSIGKEGYGPALGSVSKRLPESWLISFIRNSQSVIRKGDPYATQLYHAFDNKTMVPMEFLSHSDVRAILAYIEFASASEHHIAGVNGRTASREPDHAALAAVSLYNVHPEQPAFMIFMIVITVMGAFIHGFLVVKLFKYLNKGQPHV